MALSQAQKDAISKDAGVKDAFETGDKAAAKLLANLAIFALPGGGTVRIAKVAGKVAKGPLARLRKMFPKAKRVQNPTKKQIEKAKPVSKLNFPVPGRKPKPPKKNEVIEGKAVEKKPAAGTSVVKKADSKVTTPGTSVIRVINPGKTMKRVQGTDKARTIKQLKSNLNAAQKAKSASAIKKILAALAALGVVGTAATIGGGTDKPAAGGAGDGGKKKPVPTPTPKPPKKRKPTGTYDRTPVETTKPKKKSPKSKPGATTPNTKKMPTKGRPVTAGKNTGFGPKGNIFPSNAAERAALMKMYGGTGSAAAKRAADGKQGDIEAGRAAYQKAKRERLKGKK